MILYRLGEAAARRRARASALLGGATSIAPLLLAVVLLHRLGWGPSLLFGCVAAALGVLVAVRAAVRYDLVRRKLVALTVRLDDTELRVDSGRDAIAIARPHLARIVEVEGALGGLAVESRPQARGGVVLVANVPRGGDGYAEVRAALQEWRPIERRGRGRPSTRVLLAVVIVAGFFFVPFFLDDFVARSKFLAAGLVAGSWIVMRTVLRGR